MNRALIWPIVIVLSMVSLGFLVAADIQSPVRQLLAFWALLICPGMAYVPLLRLKKPVAELILALALSAALSTLVAEILMLAKIWSSDMALDIMMGFALLGVILQLRFLPDEYDEYEDDILPPMSRTSSKK